MIQQFLYYLFVSSALEPKYNEPNLNAILNALNLNLSHISTVTTNINPTTSPPTPIPSTYQYKTPLIPRDDLFGNPDKTRVKLSPDGKVLSYLAPVNGVLNIWVQPLDQVLSGANTARAVTFDKGRGISDYEWTYKSGVLVYQQDAGGDENFVLYKLDVRNPRTPRASVLTDTKGVRATILEKSRFHPNSLITGLNDRNPVYHDIYRLNLETGRKELMLRNDEFAEFKFDNDMQIRLGLKMNQKGGMDYYRRNPTKSPVEWLVEYIHPQCIKALSTSLIGFDKSNTKSYWLSSEGRRDLNALYVADFDHPERKQLLFEPKKGDVDNVWMHPTEHVPLVVKEEYDYPQLSVLNDTVRADIDYLKRLETVGRLQISGTSTDMRTWLVGFIRDDGPVDCYIYLRSERKAKFLFSSPASLLKHKHSKMAPVEVRTRDGHTQLCYVSIPVEFETERPLVPRERLPLLMSVHGGPWARDSWGFNSETQLFANRGYAVMQCNFRSSTGLGKNWINAGNAEWGRKMHYDLLDAVQWAIDNGIADKSRIGIFGSSYGGYATLAALTFSPDTFKCGVDVVGPSNLETLMKTFPPYWKPIHNRLVKRIGGDPATDEGRKFLASRSPVNFADRIKSPLLIFQGENDPRVKKSESDQIVAAMKSHNIPVSYVLFPNEGHGFARPENQLAYMAITEQFLASCLGGRAEPTHLDVGKSSAQIIERGGLLPTIHLP